MTYIPIVILSQTNQLQLAVLRLIKIYTNVDFIIYQNLNFIPKAWNFSVNESWAENLNYYFLDSQVKSQFIGLIWKKNFIDFRLYN